MLKTLEVKVLVKGAIEATSATAHVGKMVQAKMENTFKYKFYPSLYKSIPLAAL